MITLTYKHISGLDLHIDVYPPTDVSPSDTGSSIQKAPVILFFHGGGLTVGNRKSWFPTWMHRRFTAKGYLFISADYRLVPPATGHEIVEDIKDLWAFLNDSSLEFSFPELTKISKRMRIEPGAIAVAGVSAGGLCAYLCAMHCREPPPRAVLSLYGMGGDFLTPHYLIPKTQPFFRGRDLLDPTDPSLRPFVFPYPPSKRPPPPTSDSPLSYQPPSHPTHPGYPSNPRMLLARMYLQLGTWLDYYTGDLGMSAQLKEVLGFEGAQGSDWDKEESQRRVQCEGVINSKHLVLLPQVHLAELEREGGGWPLTMLIHGTEDTAVPIQESRNLYLLLKRSRGNTRGETAVEDLLVEVPGAEHSFDLVPNAEDVYVEAFDRAVQFVHDVISKTQ